MVIISYIHSYDLVKNIFSFRAFQLVLVFCRRILGLTYLTLWYSLHSL